MTAPPDNPAVGSCVHCRTVTWAGNPACGCAFGQLAVNEEAVNAFLLPVGDTSAAACNDIGATITSAGRGGKALSLSARGWRASPRRQRGVATGCQLVGYHALQAQILPPPCPGEVV